MSHEKFVVTDGHQSPAFVQGYFVQLVPHLRSLLLLDCPNFDVDTLIEGLQRVKRHKMITVMDLTGVPSVASFHVWQICSLCPNLQEAYSQAVMGDFVAEQCFLDCEKINKFNCWPLAHTAKQWVQLRKHYPQVAFGEHICSLIDHV